MKTNGKQQAPRFTIAEEPIMIQTSNEEILINSIEAQMNAKTAIITAKVSEGPSQLQLLNRSIARTIAFKDRMFDINNALKKGTPEEELRLSVFEIELRAKEGNYQEFKQKNGNTVKLFSWDLIERSLQKIRDLRKEKERELQLASMGMAA